MARKNTAKNSTSQPEIVQQGHPVLRGKAREITKEEFGTAKLKEIVAEMETALAGQIDGVALAAPQIGLPLRIFVVAPKAFKILKKEKGEKVVSTEQDQTVYINPKFVKLSKNKKQMEEGCLSVRRFYGTVPRSDRATIEAYDIDGNKFTRGAGGLLAQIFQHETDHLNGILFVDKASHLEEMTPEEFNRVQAEIAKENEQYK